MSDKTSRINLWRRITQTAFVFLLNPAFLNSAFTFRQACFPVLNCWGCPIAAFSCPIGALGQFFAHGVFPFLVLGTIVFAGAVLGRMLCGWVCPFGFIQDLLYKIPLAKIKLPSWLNYGKYLTLFIMVILIPLFFGVGLTPGKTTAEDFFFCNLCPAGTLEAAIPNSIIAANAPPSSDNASTAVVDPRFAESSQQSLWLSFLKSPRIWILIVFLFLFILISRPFCRAVCPIGGMFALFNRFSIYKMAVDKNKCTECNLCYKICPTGTRAQASPNSPECIRCLACQPKCPETAIENQYF